MRHEFEKEPITDLDHRQRVYNERTRAELRGLVFKYIANGNDPEQVRPDYEFNAGAFSWEPRAIFEKDVEIGMRAKQGFSPKRGGKEGEVVPVVYTLDQLIRKENETAVDASKLLRIPRVIFPRVS